MIEFVKTSLTAHRGQDSSSTLTQVVVIVDRIFLPLSFISSASLIVAMVLGLMIDDPKVRSAAVQAGVQYHFLAALAGLVLATMVHAIVLTYFMGTGRWIEETSQAYRLNPEFHARSARIKYRTIPLMVICFIMLVVTGAFGAAADPASPMQAKSWGGVSLANLHLIAAMATIGVNLLVNWLEFRALEQNGQVVDQILAEVRRIRIEKGLAVDG
ncbi:hypothetical protein [Schlesneria paludicola]|uniref:hypothetical protein n=1 Tax=Schlesneria paludicola TaxID=360056 RepID=UPI00029B228C|nr:hypothetical protein [Schlesneria paludicola]